ncbi:MAG TPA: DUF1080 domain-containing protein [Planctomycetota bacterium]|nr:DUF1080 domain-containing protein [Planctomycetota bacterium]
MRLFRALLAWTLTPGVLVASAAPQEELWNGRDFTGFYTYLRNSGRNNDPDHVFQVLDGMIHVSGKEFGYFATEREYENYILRAEFKWGEGTWPPREKKARDSGILFHMQGPDKVWPRSFEFQIIEGGTGDLLLIDHASIDFDPALESRFAEPKKKMCSDDGERIVRGRVNWEKRSPQWDDVLGFRGEEDLERPRGDWNTLELECRGDRITYWVNGTKVVETHGARPCKGRILFQSEGAEIYFRKITLRPL